MQIQTSLWSLVFLYCGATADRFELHDAVLQGDLRAVQFLIDKNPKQINDQAPHSKRSPDAGFTPLHAAAWIGRADILECLLKHRAEVNLQSEEGFTALHFAIRGRGSKTEIQSLVNLLLSSKTQVDRQDKRGRTALWYAVERGYTDIVQRLLERQASPALADTDARTPLYVAAALGHEKIVRLLLKHGVSAAPSTRSGLTPLHEAYWGGHLEIAELLRKKATRIDLLLACYLGDKERIERFLKTESTLVNAADAEGRTLLHWAVAGGHSEIAEVLLRHDADPNALMRRDRFTPLHGAVASGQYDLVALLLKHGADPGAKDGVGWTPLHLTVDPSHRMPREYATWPLTPGWKRASSKAPSGELKGNYSFAVRLRILKLLLDNSLIDIDAQTHDWDNVGGLGLHPGNPNWSALHLVAKHGWTNAANLLLDNGATVDLRDQTQRIALYYAIEGGHNALVQLLLAHHTPVNITDYRGETPLRFALRLHQNEIANLLRKSGAKETLPPDAK